MKSWATKTRKSGCPTRPERLRRGTEEAGGDAGDQPARRQPLAVGAQIISKSRNDAAFPSGQRPQADPRNLLGRFLPALGATGLARNLMKFAHRRAWAESADADATAADFFGERLGEQQVERFGRGMGRDVGHALKRRGRSDDEDVAAAPLDHRRQVKVREVDDSGDVHLNSQ